MEEFYDPRVFYCSDDHVAAGLEENCFSPIDNLIQSENRNEIIKTQIINHPKYPSLLSTYMECLKVGMSPEIASIFDDQVVIENRSSSSYVTDIGADPELDNFMEMYLVYLQQYKEEICKPLIQVTAFLREIKLNLDKETMSYPVEEQSCSVGKVVEATTSDTQKSSTTTTVHHDQYYGDQSLKDELLNKYGGYISNIKKGFKKKMKKGKLPRDARLPLLDWWKTHPLWPYPTEEEKTKLVEITGLDHKQITNWFINQRKRHWKPSEDQDFPLMDSISDILHFEDGEGTPNEDQ